MSDRETAAKHDLIFFEKRSTPKVVSAGASFTAPESYGRQTRRRAATAEEEKVIARGDWLRVDQSGKKGGQPGYKKTKMAGREHLVRGKSALDLRAQLRERYMPEPELEREEALRTDVHDPSSSIERAFVHHAASGRTIITAPVSETARQVAASGNTGFLYLHGRFVEADNANDNGAYWSSEDLQLAQRSVAGGPLNWLHEETHIVGTLLDGRFVDRQAAAEWGVGAHIQSTAAMWRFLFPKESDIVEKAAADSNLYYSMECVSETVTCLDRPGRPGCGEEFAYPDFLGRRACAHLNQRQSAARFNQPLFLGGALIVPPVRPGWANADVDVVRQAAAVTEAHQLAAGGLTRPGAEAMVTRVLEWANR